MSRRFAHKVVLVTGATSGIGRAAARRLAGEGAKVVLAARGQEAGEALASGLRTVGGEATFVRVDVTVESEVAELVREAVRRYGRLDGAFNNVGAPTAEGPLTGIEAAAWRADLELNLDSVFYGLKHEIPAIRSSGGGAIVNNASVCGVGAQLRRASYNAAKHGVIGLSRSAALETADAGIRINALVTGGVDTPLSRSLAQDQPGLAPQDAWRAAIAMHPLGRMAQPCEVAAFAAFLLSDEAGFITGAALTIDGGMTARL
ncbi:SDR family NAD(P)-dependent oxidoreductase [Streptomyces sp. NPDC089424]|uniref:SDR family NAD(P)-dependent oxidoreductase n=1 Tax=Streptomyces sp. NPDC089424 TaxID=3365917 RepID=UPI0038216A4F